MHSAELEIMRSQTPAFIRNGNAPTTAFLVVVGNFGVKFQPKIWA